MTVRRVGELQIEDLGVLLGLVKPVAPVLLRRLRLNHCDHQVAGVSQQVIRPSLGRRETRVPATTIRPSVKLRCSQIWSSVHPAP